MSKKVMLIVVVEGNNALISTKVKTWPEFQKDQIELVTVPSLARANGLDDSEIWLDTDAVGTVSFWADIFLVKSVVTC